MMMEKNKNKKFEGGLDVACQCVARKPLNQTRATAGTRARYVGLRFCLVVFVVLSELIIVQGLPAGLIVPQVFRITWDTEFHNEIRLS